MCIISFLSPFVDFNRKILLNDADHFLKMSNGMWLPIVSYEIPSNSQHCEKLCKMMVYYPPCIDWWDSLLGTTDHSHTLWEHRYDCTPQYISVCVPSSSSSIDSCDGWSRQLRLLALQCATLSHCIWFGCYPQRPPIHRLSHCCLKIIQMTKFSDLRNHDHGHDHWIPINSLLKQTEFLNGV